MLNCSIGIMAYNEEANIGNLLDALLSQKTDICEIKEIYVVASGCKDRTEDIVRDYSLKDGRIKLLVQPRREGKASAINLFLSVSQGEIIILESADTIPEVHTIENMITPFWDPLTGMTGGRPVPVDRSDDFLGFTVNLLWRLHHMISLDNPKMGELVAFRNVLKEIPIDTATDEASIEAIIINSGYRIKYAENAIVYNKGPENLRDFISQRRRIAAGHLYVSKTQNRSVSTSSVRNILIPLLKNLRWSAKELVWTLGGVTLEACCRLLGYYDFYIKKRNPYVWDIAASTKKLKRTLN
jgi:cellulose synthase/poly-beta-1,6-N-acetylglucosamine synthase-like glycosyltransferase